MIIYNVLGFRFYDHKIVGFFIVLLTAFKVIIFELRTNLIDLSETLLHRTEVTLKWIHLIQYSYNKSTGSYCKSSCCVLKSEAFYKPLVMKYPLAMKEIV